MDWSEKVLCIKCNEGGNLLVCNEDGCPLAVHESCMGCPARFDDAGRYYCPYCFYKRAVAESRKVREYALAKKKVLLLFMNEKMMMGSENNVHNEKIITCNNGSKVNSDAKEQKIGNAEEEKVQQKASSGSKGRDPSPKMDDEQSISNEVEKKSQQEESGGSSGSKCQDPSPKLDDEQSISSEEETRNQAEKHRISAASSGQNSSRNKHNICDFEEERIQEDISSPSTAEDLKGTTTRRSKMKKPVERDRAAVSYPTMKKKTSPTVNFQRKSPRKSASALETKKGSNQVVDSSKRGKRKRLFWTEKEEEALKEGVEIFSKQANINIPWRKILHIGRGVFDATRTPTDLKDKWKIMCSK